jgi:hypothetical protein
LVADYMFYVIKEKIKIYVTCKEGTTDYIAYLGMEKGEVTPSVCCLTSVSHINRNLWHECRRFLIIDQCLSVTPTEICGTNATDFQS